MQHELALRELGKNRHSLPIEQAVDAAVEHQKRQRGLSPTVFPVYVGNWKMFARFAAAQGVQTAADVSQDLVLAFLDAPFAASRVLPADSSKGVRRSSLRKLFACLRAINVVNHDPLADIVLARPHSCGARPLTDTEVETCRYYASRRRGHTRTPALWALVESGATHPEIKQSIVGNVDLAGAVILLPGGPGTAERVVPLNQWCVKQLGSHIEKSGLAEGDHVLFGGTPPTSRGSTIKQNLGRIFELAGLRDDPRATTYSVRGWLGRQVWDGTERIECVADRLGLASTDRAWEVIDVDWRKLV